LGRRRSVAGATSRRCPSARTRPGAGYLPTLALGRPRGPPPLRAARDVAAPTLAPPMTLLRRPPRQVYRVYSEEEFLAAEDWSLEPPAEGPSSSPWGRVAGIAALTGAVAMVVGVVVMSESRSGVSRRSTLGMLASNRSSRSAPAAPPPSSQPIGRDMRRHGRAPRSPERPRRIAQWGGARELAQTRVPAVAATSTAALPPAPTPPVAPDPAPTSPPATSPAPPPATTPPATASANSARAEFGFERQAG
jgi:hypothetical protein